jgi:hypothetical protein
MKGIVNRQCHLIGNQRKELDFLRRIRVELGAADAEASQAPVRCLERKRTKRSNALAPKQNRKMVIRIFS